MGPRLDREVALKLLPAARILREGSPSSVIHEGRLLARVRHPNVVTIYGAEQIGTRVGLWMELVRGRTIDQIVREGKLFSGAEAIAIGVELCDALTAVHGAGLLHRDIKAQNAMVADDARVVLMDFGTGREVADAAASDLAGTPLYLAPEVLGGGEATVQSDIYSLGVLLYYMVSGTHPVRARDLRNLCRAHERRTRTDVRALRPDLSPVLAAIIHRATDPQPDRRYATAALLAEELKAAGSGPRSAAIGAGAHQKHWWFTSILAAACLSLVGLSCYNQRQITKQAAARHVFYAMKALDVDIANLERRIAQSGNAEANSQLQEYMRRRRGIQSVYDRYVERLNLYSTDLSQEEQLILRVTRLFGESELAAPNDYIESIKGYIRKWQSSGRFERAIRIADQMGYARPIAEEFLAQNLPPQFFYLAMQESTFDPFVIGPLTHHGIAKGMWQLLPQTATRYGLAIGPLEKLPTPDLGDDRQNWQEATRAAARYIKDLYSTDAQGSGLLVIASYNWGEGRVINLLGTMPLNPEDRNFWKLLEQHRDTLPHETYDYVFRIVSAAIIGENPRLFGFQFDNPLGFLEKR